MPVFGCTVLDSRLRGNDGREGGNDGSEGGKYGVMDETSGFYGKLPGIAANAPLDTAAKPVYAAIVIRAPSYPGRKTGGRPLPERRPPNA